MIHQLKALVLLGIIHTCTNSAAQSSYIQPRSMTYHLVDRYRVLYDVETPMVISTSNYMRDDVTRFADSIYTYAATDIEKAQIAYLIDDNVEHYQLPVSTSDTTVSKIDNVFYQPSRISSRKRYQPEDQSPLFRHFYKHKATFWEVKSPHFWLKANPVLDIGGGFSRDTETTVFSNVRGVDIRGMIDNKVYFYTNILETQRGFLNFQEQTIIEGRAIPGNGLYKGYQSAVADQLSGYDYLNSTAYVGMPISKHINIELGHGSNFLGTGYRSLLLSDFANNYFYVKLQSRIGKFQLQNIFAELAAVSNPLVQGDELLPKKYFAAHYLTYRPTNRIAISLFETVVFSRENNFELQYLNPIILYRTVEQFIGSPDNVMLGIDIRWDLWKRVSLYGQLILDEFNITQLRETNGWWGNKIGVQAGAKYFDAFDIAQLDLQVEANVVRPWTYSHRRPIDDIPAYALTNYTHYNQPLAHPLGANFAEVMLLARYQPSAEWTLKAKGIFAVYGADTEVEPFGGNIFLPSGERLRQDGYGIADGDRQTIRSLEIVGSYQFAHNYFIDITALLRDQTSDLGSRDVNTLYAGIGIRANIAQMPIDY